MAERVISSLTYIVVCIILVLMTFVTVSVSFIHLPQFWHIAFGLIIGLTKASLVVLFFMHVKQASRVTWVFAGSAFLWLGIMIALILTDYGTRRNQPGAVNEAPAVQFMHAQQSPG